MGLLDEPIISSPPPPPDPAVVEENRRRFEQDRAERAERDARTAPLRRAVLEAGPELRDIDAAMTCGCSCHPRVHDDGLHNGGTACPCQSTPEQRRAAFDALLNSDVSHDLRAAQDELVTDFDELATELAVDASLAVMACPTLVTGTVDATRFFARERHGEFRVEVSLDPDCDPWEDQDATTLIISTGTCAELGDGPTALELLTHAVEAVRLYEVRTACDHGAAPAGSRFCNNCGVRLPAV